MSFHHRSVDSKQYHSTRRNKRASGATAHTTKLFGIESIFFVLKYFLMLSCMRKCEGVFITLGFKKSL
jgi:hypothetical protein